MSLLRNCLLEVRNPFILPKRFRGKINIQKPKPPHFEKAKYLALTKPYFISPKKNKSLIELCKKNSSQDEKELENPFQRILAREALEFFRSSKLIGFYHSNPMTASDQFHAFSTFKKEGMTLKNFGRKTLEMAVKGTPYEAVLDLYISRNMIVFSPEPKLKQLLKMNKRFPQLVLLAGVYEGKFVSFEDLVKYNSIPNLETAQAILVRTLELSANKLHRQLTCNQTSLHRLLEDRKKQLGDEKD